jgi:hypothetical protein
MLNAGNVAMTSLAYGLNLALSIGIAVWIARGKRLLRPYDSVTCMQLFKSRLWESN